MDRETDSRLACLPIAEVVEAVRIVNHLEAAGYIYVGDLLRLTQEELRAIPNLGAAAVEQLKAALAAAGIYNRAWGMRLPRRGRR